jgi:hypothetical protein
LLIGLAGQQDPDNQVLRVGIDSAVVHKPVDANSAAF